MFIKTHYFSIPGVVKSRICWKQQKSSRSSSPSNLPLYFEKRNFDKKQNKKHGRTAWNVQIYNHENELTLILAKKFTYPWPITGALNTIMNIFLTHQIDSNTKCFDKENTNNNTASPQKKYDNVSSRVYLVAIKNVVTIMFWSSFFSFSLSK